MLKKTVAAVLALCMLLTSGCGGAADKSSSSAKSEQETTQKKSKETTKSESGSSGTKAEATPAANGEGAPASEPLGLNDGSNEKVGNTVKLENGQVKYELTINDVSYTDKRDENLASPKKVVLINYTYRNLSEESLLIDDMRFQFRNSDGSKVFDTYYFPDQKIPEQVQKDGSCQAQIAFAVNDDIDDFVLVYQDSVHTDLGAVKFDVNLTN